MTSQELMDGLGRRLGELFKGYTLLNKAGVLQEIRIFYQYVPQPSGVTVTVKGMKNYQDNDYEANFPCIVIQSTESKYLEERNIAQAVHNIRLLIGIYDDNSECQGWRDIANISDRIINSFSVDRIVEQKFRMNMPMVMKYIDVETWPVYFGEVVMSFDVGRAMMRHDYIHQMKDINEVKR